MTDRSWIWWERYECTVHSYLRIINPNVRGRPLPLYGAGRVGGEAETRTKSSQNSL